MNLRHWQLSGTTLDTKCENCAMRRSQHRIGNESENPERPGFRNGGNCRVSAIARAKGVARTQVELLRGSTFHARAHYFCVAAAEAVDPVVPPTDGETHPSVGDRFAAWASGSQPDERLCERCGDPLIVLFSSASCERCG